MLHNSMKFNQINNTSNKKIILIVQCNQADLLQITALMYLKMMYQHCTNLRKILEKL